MAKKKVLITISDDLHTKANNLSVLVLGDENFSGIVAYALNKLHKETKK